MIIILSVIFGLSLVKTITSFSERNHHAYTFVANSVTARNKRNFTISAYTAGVSFIVLISYLLFLFF